MALAIHAAAGAEGQAAWKPLVKVKEELPKLGRLDLQALRYVVNTNGRAGIAQFDEDHDPIGPLLRRVLLPRFMVLDDSERLRLTPLGIEVLAAAEDPNLDDDWIPA